MNKNYTDDVVIHIKDGNIEYLKFKDLEKFNDKIDVKVFLNRGGASEGVYKSLNVRVAGNDKIENVLENIRRIAKTFNIDENRVCKGTQTHTDNILYINEKNIDKYAFNKLNEEEIDGYVTDSNKLATLVTTADCSAIVIYDPKNNAIANVHSGWKGTIKRIYLNAINKMKENFETKAEDVIVCIGPAIKACCFSSEDEGFKKQFIDLWEDEEKYIYFEKENNKRFHIDLSYVISKDLKEVGVKEENIHFANICTCCNHEDFYSYRYKTMNKEEDYGCFATVVRLK